MLSLHQSMIARGSYEQRWGTVTIVLVTECQKEV